MLPPDTMNMADTHAAIHASHKLSHSMLPNGATSGATLWYDRMTDDFVIGRLSRVLSVSLLCRLPDRARQHLRLKAFSRRKTEEHLGFPGKCLVGNIFSANIAGFE